MWHEARKQERKIRGIMVDYKKRAERRREFYEKIKQDPTQFLRIHAAPCKINLDPAVAVAAEGPGTMMPWQGDSTNMIDRFDARAHLDIIPEISVVEKITKNAAKDREEHKCNYERYRTLVQNECAGISEEQCLQQITTDEMYPEIGLAKRANEAKEKLMGKKAAIGFTYEESTPADDDKDEERGLFDSDSESSSSLSDIDIDINVDVDELDEEQRIDMNECAVKYGMAPGEYVRMLEKDKEEIEMLKRAKEEEEEKAMYSGRKSRRERRAFIEKKLRERRDIAPSPPSYARRNSPTYQPYRKRSRSQSSSRSRSTTPEDTGRVTFITSFGEENEAAAAAANTATLTTSSSKKSSELPSWDKSPMKRSKSNSSSSSISSRSRSRSGSRDSRRSSSRSWSRSRSRERRLIELEAGRGSGRSESSSSSSRSPSPVRAKSPPARIPYRRSRSRSRERYGKHSRSRSRSPRRASKQWSPGHYGRRSRSKSPEQHPAGGRDSQYSINAKLKKPELGVSKAVVSVSADKVTKTNSATKTQVTDAKSSDKTTQSRQG